MFGAINIVKNSNKDKWMYSGYRIAFDRGDWWSFGNGTASSSSHVENLKNNFLILGLGLTFGINGIPKKKFGINFTKSNTNFCLSVHYNADDSYLFVKTKEAI